jgi:hypothetical protein
LSGVDLACWHGSSQALPEPSFDETWTFVAGCQRASRSTARGRGIPGLRLEGGRSLLFERALYLPKRWTNRPLRRAEAGVPEEIVFRDRIELAEEMLERAFAAAVPARWVVANSFYGRSHAFRVWLEERGHPYAV